MKTRFFASLALALMCLMPMTAGCSLRNGGPGHGGDGGGTVDWDQFTEKTRVRVKYVAAFAFELEAVKPHKQAVCDAANQISEILDNYQDQDASFEAVRNAVMSFVNQIQNDAVRNAVTIFVDLALTEAFNYAWEYYEDLINQDEAQAAITLAKAVADGLRDACEMSVNAMGATASSHPDGIFTIPSG